MTAHTATNPSKKIPKRNETRANGLNTIWSSSSSFEAVPTTSFNYLSPARVNGAFVGSSPSIDLARLASIPTNRPTRHIDFSNYSNHEPSQADKRNVSRASSSPPKSSKSSFFRSARGKLLLKLCVSISVLILLACAGLTIFASIKPCTFVKCHPKASLCIDRFPFWAQCICDANFAGNGKSVCAECGLSNVSPNVLRIVGGKVASPSSWPFAVYIVQTYMGRYNIKGINYVISSSWSCGGILINPKTILTAAHCIHEETFDFEDEDGEIYILQMQWNEWYSSLESTFDVYVGITDISSINNSSKLRIKKINRHEDYDEFDFKNDIATIQLHDNVERSYKVQYACLPYNQSTSYPEVDQQAFIVGWGRVSEIGESSSELKNSAVRVFDNRQCNKVEDKINKYYESQVCAGALDGSTDTCQGDSGGGLFVRASSVSGSNRTVFYAAGVVSYGEGCARRGKPGIYTRTSYFIDWIRKYSDY